MIKTHAPETSIWLKYAFYIDKIAVKFKKRFLLLLKLSSVFLAEENQPGNGGFLFSLNKGSKHLLFLVTAVVCDSKGSTTPG